MPVLCLLSLISCNSPTQLGMVSPELPRGMVSPELPREDLPEHLLADEHHQPLDGQKLPGVGCDVELRPVAPGDGARERGLAVPGRVTQPALLSRQLASELAGVDVPGRIPVSTHPNP